MTDAAVPHAGHIDQATFDHMRELSAAEDTLDGCTCATCSRALLIGWLDGTLDALDAANARLAKVEAVVNELEFAIPPTWVGPFAHSENVVTALRAALGGDGEKGAQE